MQDALFSNHTYMCTWVVKGAYIVFLQRILVCVVWEEGTRSYVRDFCYILLWEKMECRLWSDWKCQCCFCYKMTTIFSEIRCNFWVMNRLVILSLYQLTPVEFPVLLTPSSDCPVNEGKLLVKWMLAPVRRKLIHFYEADFANPNY